jgi:anaerobic selenocysteine-containing dehydrogenase
MDRRTFIKLTAVTGTTATLASCGSPENQLIRFIPAEDITPGVATWKPGVCAMCSAGCGLTVRVMAADADVVRNGQAGVVRIAAAKKLEGAPDHPVNHGGLCVRGQAAIQVTYHPDRITQPLKRSGNRGDGRYQAVSWDAALAELAGQFDALGAAGRSGAVAAVTRAGFSQRRAVLDGFMNRLGAPAPVVYELFSDDVLRRANAMSFGREQLPTFDIGNAMHVLSFGADFLGTWNSPVAHSAAYGRMRQGRAGRRGSFVQVEARMSQTGANADEWVPVTPGTEGVLALGIASEIINANLRPAAAAGRAGAQIDGWGSGLASYTPEEVQKVTGVAPQRLARLARQFGEAAPAVAIVAGPPLAHTNGLFTALAVNALNALVGNVGQPGGVHFTPQPAAVRSGSSAALKTLADTLLSGGDTAPQVLLIDGANPVFGAPKAWKVREAFARVSFIASFGSFIDETSAMADLILPDHSFLESWVDAVPESGALEATASVAPPVMRPLHETRATPDVLLELGRRLTTASLGAAPAWQTYDAMLASSFGTLPAPAGATDAWADAQAKGVWTGTLPAAQLAAPAAVAGDRQGATTAYAPPQFDGDATQFPMHFLPFPSVFHDGSAAHLPWLQELPDPMTSAMWSSWVEINPQTAERLGIALGDIVTITSSQGTLQVAAVISPGLAPDVVAMPVGQGHQMFTRFASGRGQNPIELLAPLTETSTGALAWAATRVSIAKAGPPDGRLVLFAGGMREEHHEPDRGFNWRREDARD